MPSHSSPAQYVILLLDLISQQGADPSLILKNTSFERSGIQVMGARVNESDLLQMLNNSNGISGDKVLGLHLGEKLNPSAHAVLGQAFLTCESLGLVIELFMKYYQILSPTLEVNYYQKDNRCYLQPINSGALSDRFGYETFFSAVKNTLTAMLGGNVLELAFEFNYPQPDYVDEYRRVLGADLSFDAKITQLSFDQKLLSLTLPTSNPALLALYEQECKRVLTDIESEQTVAEQTLRLLRKLEGHYPQMSQTAQLLNMSTRTYRRRLAEEGFSFQQLLNTVRLEHVDYYLTKTNLPMFSIALNVGFNDASNFRRAYVKWTGETPQQTRLNKRC
jgi:AraC-like DNA-binding protein